MRIFKNDFDITDGIEIEIVKAIDRSIANNSTETFRVLLDFIRSVIQLSVSNRSLIHFQKYIFFPAHIYNTSYTKAKQNPELIHLHRFCSERAAMHQKEILLSDIGFERSRFKKSNQIVELNKFYYQGFNAFSKLLYSIIQNRDESQFKVAMNEFDQVTDSNYNSHYNLKYEIMDLERENHNGINDFEIKQKKEELILLKAFDDYKRHTIIGIKYWIIFLFSEHKIDEEMANSFIERLNINVDSDNLLQDVLFFGQLHSDYYMDWSDWDHIERTSGKGYNPPSPHNWLLLGFIVDQIRGNQQYINIENLNSDDLSKAKYLYDSLKQKTEYLISNFEKWSEFLNVDSVKELKSKCDNLLRLFAELKRKKIGSTEIAIANAILSQAHVVSFRNMVGKAWKYQSRMHSLFKQNANAEEIIDEEAKLKIIGSRTFYVKAKMAFIEGEHFQNITGLAQFGGELGRIEDNNFFSAVVGKEHNLVSASSAVEALDLSIAELKSKNIEPNLILLSPEYSYRDQLFLTENRFKSKGFEERNDDPTWHFFLGSFDEIPIFTSHSGFLKNKIIVCNFNLAFKMKYKTNPHWFDREFEVEVSQVSDDEAQKRLDENPEKWKNTEEGVTLTDEEALIAIKTSVILDMGATVEFHILDKNAYVVAYIKA
jgi:hypothetical protein